jgi:hypothetical protein
MKFPILKNKPANTHCINCKHKLNGDFYVFNAGALKKIDKDHQIMGNDMKGFCSLNAHIDSQIKYESLSIVETAPMGQFEIYACSISCLRKFFEKIFDEFQKKIK